MRGLSKDKRRCENSLHPNNITKTGVQEGRCASLTTPLPPPPEKKKLQAKMKAWKYFSDSVKQGLQPEQCYFGREITEREHTKHICMLENIQTKYLNARHCLTSMSAALKCQHMLDNLHSHRQEETTHLLQFFRPFFYLALSLLRIQGQDHGVPSAGFLTKPRGGGAGRIVIGVLFCNNNQAHSPMLHRIHHIMIMTGFQMQWC